MAQTVKKLDYLQQASIEKGEQLFLANCNKCHEVCKQNLGPSLSDVMYKRPLPWLVSFIQNSQEIIGSGDPYAENLYKSYNAMVMPSYPDLSREDIINILAYIDGADGSNRKDTVIGISTEVSALIKNAPNNIGSKQANEKDYYVNTNEYKLTMAEESVTRGKGLFNAQCSKCHEICQTKIGPALASVSQRRPLPWLVDFIKSPKNMVKSGDDYASFLVTNYSFVMPNFNYLPDEDLLDIISYIRSESSAGASAVGVNSQMISEGTIIRQSATDTIESKDYEEMREDGETRTFKKTEDMHPVLKILTILVIAALLALLIFGVSRFFKGRKGKGNNKPTRL